MLFFRKSPQKIPKPPPRPCPPAAGGPSTPTIPSSCSPASAYSSLRLHLRLRQQPQWRPATRRVRCVWSVSCSVRANRRAAGWIHFLKGHVQLGLDILITKMTGSLFRLFWYLIVHFKKIGPDPSSDYLRPDN